MDTFIVECFLPRAGRAELDDVDRRARAAARWTPEADDGVRYLGALSMPTDEVVFFLFAGPSQDAVRDAALRASVSFERILPSLFVLAGYERIDR